MLNMGVLTIPLHEAGGVCASVTHGAKNTKTVPGDIIHKRYLHRHADVLARLPRCAHDVPDEWASAVRSAAKTPCDHCLHSSADAQPSSHKAPDVTAPGDLISYDVWEVGVGHVHGGQRKVINFHDHYSRINKPYLIHKYSDAPARSISMPTSMEPVPVMARTSTSVHSCLISRVSTTPLVSGRP